MREDKESVRVIDRNLKVAFKIDHDLLKEKQYKKLILSLYAISYVFSLLQIDTLAVHVCIN
jgi:hypothetical protein